jgi:hypothetical protein
MTGKPDFSGDIRDEITVHITRLQNRIAVGDFRGAYRYAWFITAAIYYRCVAEEQGDFLMGEEPRG